MATEEDVTSSANRERTRTQWAIILSALASPVILGGLLGARYIGERQERENAAREVMTGVDNTPPIKDDEIVNILAQNPGARKHWEELKARMEKIERGTVEKIDGRQQNERLWEGRIESKTTPNSLP